MNVLLIEDEKDIGELISYSLEKEGYTVRHVTNANDGLVVLEEIAIDFILLDLMLPGLKGNDFLKVIRTNKKFENIPIIIESAKNSEQEIISCLNAGADDYLPKPFSMEMLDAKIKSILRRGTSFVERKNAVIQYQNIKIDCSTYIVYVDNEEVKLTLKELELLKLFIQNPGRVYSRDILLNTIWGYHSDSYTRTVDSHIASLRRKLGSSGEKIKSVPKVGYGVE